MAEEGTILTPSEGSTEEGSTEEGSTQETQTTENATEGTSGSTEAGKTEGTILDGAGESGKEGSTEPINYTDFTVPEGMEIDTGLVEALSPVMQDAKLSQENAQKLVDAYAPYQAKQAQAQQEKAVADWNTTVDGWKADTTKELGTAYKADITTAGKFMDQFGDKESRQILKDSGLGNHPAIVRMIVKAGKAISEDTFVDPDKINDTTAESDAVKISKMYPSMQKT